MAHRGTTPRQPGLQTHRRGPQNHATVVVESIPTSAVAAPGPDTAASAGLNTAVASTTATIELFSIAILLRVSMEHFTPQRSQKPTVSALIAVNVDSFFGPARVRAFPVPWFQSNSCVIRNARSNSTQWRQLREWHEVPLQRLLPLRLPHPRA
jgi:hypothetical protein